MAHAEAMQSQPAPYSLARSFWSLAMTSTFSDTLPAWLRWFAPVESPSTRHQGVARGGVEAAPVVTRRNLPGPIERLLLHQQVEFWMGQIDPLWSAREVRARVVSIVQETPDTQTCVLHPNLRWTGFRAGQYIPVHVEVNGVRHRRLYSVSSAPRDEGTITITVTRRPGGVVSGWLHDHLREGDVLPIGQAMGDFQLPTVAPERIAFVCAGSGITPIFSMLLHLGIQDKLNDVTLVYYARTKADHIFGARLRSIAQAFPGLHIHLLTTRGENADERLSVASMLSRVPDMANRQTWVCGPESFVTAAQAIWRTAGWKTPTVEAFVPFVAPVSTDVTQVGRTSVEHRVSGVTDTREGTTTLLDRAEAQGLSPKSGCRMGICHTCTCHKISGAVKDLRTGVISSAPDETIQLCVSVACSDVVLDL
jgi:ferredoxin-NADP reductase